MVRANFRVASLMTALFLSGAGFSFAEPGIAIVPDESGVFEYTDDFTTPKVLVDSFVDESDLGVWTPGQLVSAGPVRRRHVVYRFYGQHLIETVGVSIEQKSNARHLGGRTNLEVSENGVDWKEADSSARIEPDANAWQTGVLTLGEKPVVDFAGKGEFWFRLTLENYSGLKTFESNIVDNLQVRFQVDPNSAVASTEADSAETAWGGLREATAWKASTLDWRDPEPDRAPHYYEDVDGWLVNAAEHPVLNPDEGGGFPITKIYSQEARPTTGLGLFVELDEGSEPVMARVLVQASQRGFRKLQVFWDGQLLDTFDTASFFDVDKPLYVALKPGQGIHELRITAEDTGETVVRRVEIAGKAVRGWAAKPALPEGGALEVLSAYYMPDPEPPANSQVVEGRKRPDMEDVSPGVGLTFKGMQRMYAEHEEFGAVRLVFRNAGEQPVRIGEPLLNGTPIDEHYVDFAKTPWDAPGVVWYRIRPRTLAPGECGQAYVRFRKRLPGEGVHVSLSSENAGTVEAEIPYVGPKVIVDYVVTSPDRRVLYIYGREQGSEQAPALAGVSLDGQALEGAAIYGADYPGGVALAVTKLAEPLQLGAYHVAGLHLADGQCVAAQFRVLPHMYPRSSVHVPVELCGPLHMNLATWWARSLEECQEHDIYTSAMMDRIFGVHERVAYVLGPDEPDAKDNIGGGYDKGLGWNVRKLAESGWQELLERYNWPVPSWLNINGTVRPLNWAVYGQFGDINGFDPYPVTYYGADHAYVRESMEHVRECAAPTPVFAFLEAYGWASGQGVPSKVRGPACEEYRQNVVQAIGTGVKGLSSWVYSAGAGGWQLNEEFAAEIGRCNQLIERIAEPLVLGTPIDIVSNDAGAVLTGTVDEELWEKPRVWTGALLCGPDTLVVAVANHIPASETEPLDIEPARDVTVSLSLPGYLPELVAEEVREDGCAPVPLDIQDGIAHLHVDEVHSGRVFIIQRQSP